MAKTESRQAKKELSEKVEEGRIQEEMVALRRRLREDQKHKIEKYEK